jgi:membrane-associated phospholipid phosphatase
MVRLGAASLTAGMAARWLSDLPVAFATAAGGNQLEPTAGTWKPWVLTSGSELRLPPPPDQAATASEIQQLQALAAQRDPAALALIAHWDAGSPSYRWVDTTLSQSYKATPAQVPIIRWMALLNVAIADAMIAAWDSKYAWNRLRPSDVDGTLTTVLANPASPSYPCERSVAAGAAATMLASFFPDGAQTFANMAMAVGRSRLLAGVQYPSDVQAGLDLGRAVAARVLERAKADGSDARWTGSVPTEPGHWNGMNPAFPLAGTWQTWVLASGSQLRPGPPPAYDSAQEQADLNELKAFRIAFDTMQKALYWQSNTGTFNAWYDTVAQRIFEYRLEDNAPRASRVYALVGVAHYDAMVATFDAKYTWWAIRPFQLDPTVTPLFTTPNHPSYPSSHSATFAAIATTLGHLFPNEADAMTARAEECAASRMWAGIHFRTDNEVGLALGQSVGKLIVARADADGSQ